MVGGSEPIMHAAIEQQSWLGWVLQVPSTTSTVYYTITTQYKLEKETAEYLYIQSTRAFKVLSRSLLISTPNRQHGFIIEREEGEGRVERWVSGFLDPPSSLQS